MTSRGSFRRIFGAMNPLSCSIQIVGRRILYFNRRVLDVKLTFTQTLKTWLRQSFFALVRYEYTVAR